MTVHVLCVMYKPSETASRYVTAFDLGGEEISKVASTKKLHLMQIF